jgi:hypothetical protein
MYLYKYILDKLISGVKKKKIFLNKIIPNNLCRYSTIKQVEPNSPPLK